MVISWEEYFMGLAKMSALRSKDPNTQVGACIVGQDKRIKSLGYNGMPIGCDDSKFPWGREGGMLDSKYAFVVHAELNAILNSHGQNLEGCTLYATLFPCNECCKAIIQSGIKEVVFMENKYANTDSVKASVRMFESAGVVCREYQKTGQEIDIEL